MKTFRVFFKKYENDETKKADGTIEFENKNISKALVKAEKMGRKKDMRVAMISEIIKKSGMPDKL